jgi:S1-C subfamily serine protease
LSDFTAPPTDGCLLKTSSAEIARAGLKAGDLVVALDSHPVHNQENYMFDRGLSDDPVIHFIVWRDGKYLAIDASPPDRRFGNTIGDYHHS